MNTRIFFTTLLIMLPLAMPAVFKTNIAHAQNQQISQSERMALAREFVQKMRGGFNRAENFMHPNQIHSGSKKQQNILPEGEQLIFKVYLEPNLLIDDIMFGRVENGEVILSLVDFINALDFPINVNANDQTAKGWYIRENFTFDLDLKSRTAKSHNGEFKISSNVVSDENDIFVPVDELGKWFNFDMKVNTSALSLKIKAFQKLPVQERYDREKLKGKNNKTPSNDPVLPLMPTPKRLIDVPFVDVNTSSLYSLRGDTDQGSDTTHRATIRTSNDFAYGTLKTQTQVNNQDQISSIRTNYKQESLDSNLLGPLKANRFELGDVNQTNLPISTSISNELGVRITNTDPLKNYINPTTVISGTIYPGWDVELTRGAQIIAIQRVDETGFYQFEDVFLFNNDNNFTLIFYGPQGEVRRENISIPVDASRIAEGKGVYDVSLTFDGKQTYQDRQGTSEDEASPTLHAFYEKPIAAGTAGLIGLRSDQQNGERNNVAYAGVSTLVGETLINADTAIDDEAEAAAQLVARRSFGEHDVISNTQYFMDNYDTAQNGDDSDGFLNTSLNLNGPLPLQLGINPQYNASLAFNHSNDGNAFARSTAGVSTRYKNFVVSDQLEYIKTNTDEEDILSNNLAISGNVFGKRVRLRSDYEIIPDSRLRNVNANYQHYINNAMSLEFDLNRTFDPSLTEARAQLNWLAGWARISPSISYNSDQDFTAGLNTNFGLVQDPQTHEMRSFDRSITSSGGLSVFVFLDEDGNGVINGDEKPLENITVRALQNGGRAVTNENGIAFFSRMRELRLTDVFIDERSLEDPYWIPGFEGASILPREGYVAEMQFPIHIAGELDGTLYAQSEGREDYPLRGIPVNLYNADGEIEQTATTDFGGFYLFSRVPPGRYLLLIDHNAAKTGNFARPKPEQIEIGYDGTIIYGKDIFVQAGEKDIPSTIIADLNDYKSRHPHIDFEGSDYNIALNLGEYNSRLLMSTMWYRLHTRYRDILSGGQLLVLPQNSFADANTGKHTLRVGLENGNIDNAYARCHALVARDIPCIVEVISNQKEKLAQN